jgi:hypothetical protein
VPILSTHPGRNEQHELKSIRIDENYKSFRSYKLFIAHKHSILLI